MFWKTYSEMDDPSSIDVTFISQEPFILLGLNILQIL